MATISSPPKVSVITPFRNAERFLTAAIRSVLGQTYANWELLLVDNGSTDSSASVARKFDDERIVHLREDAPGAAVARNAALSRMAGEYFCFLDADDVLPPQSLSARVAMLKADARVDFADGSVAVMDADMEKCIRIWTPQYEGDPFPDLLSLSGRSFFGLTWMIRRRAGVVYSMKDSLTHSEDLLFLMELSRGGRGSYGATNELILRYRNTPGSAMKDLAGLENGYRMVYETINTWSDVSASRLDLYKKRTRRIMVRSYIREGRFADAGRIMGNWI